MPGRFLARKYSMKIRCYTLFDITPTGIKSHFKKQTAIPWESWIKQRNQQRNWETLTQIFSLRTQPVDIEVPVETMGDATILFDEVAGQHKIWSFSFIIETLDAYATADSDVGQLLLDADGVPMIVGLDETVMLQAALDTTNKRNIYFEIEEKDTE